MWQCRLDSIVRSDLQNTSKWTFRVEMWGRTVSISTTVLKPFSDKPEMGAKKLPAAPFL